MNSVTQNANRIIIKVGSSLVTNDGRGLDHAAIARWAAQIAGLRALGKQVVLVSSGATAEGMLRLGFERRPTDIHELQACAASARWASRKTTKPASARQRRAPGRGS